jgi:6-phospho-beta-glucosidase
MTATLVVLGGSSPFTAALVEALRAVHPAVPPQALGLYGRDRAHLDQVAEHACLRLAPLGWSVWYTTRCAEALEGATCVLHQVRYGGMAGRAADERLAEAHGVPADETLGPAGLAAAVRMTPALKDLARLLRKHCPGAWVLNLTNPLSLATAILSREGVSRCVGLCELPWYTVREACRALGLPAQDVSWSYSGLNHRGFIHELTYQGRDYLKELPRVLGDETLGGITAAEIAELSALPLKYFRLLRGTPAPPGGGGRAQYLQELQARLFEELRESASEPPPSLARRYLEWYPGAVVPVLAALAAGDGRPEVLSAWREGDVAREFRARVFADRWEALPVPPPGAAVRRWLDVFAAHERAALAAALDPTPARLREALAADPVVPGEKVAALADALAALPPARYQLE